MLYFDNAATSFPKAAGVGEAMKTYIDCVGVNVNRGVYAPAQEAALTVLTLRERLCKLFHHPDLTHVVLTAGATAALNFAIKGFLRPGDHVLVSSLEHNAVMRPLVQLGVAFDRVPCDSEGRLLPDAVEPLIRPNTRLFVLTHASNVCGTIQDVAAVSALCKLYKVALLLDAAQTAGHFPIDFTALGLSAMAIPAHKGLLGPQGIGALLLTPEFAAQCEPLITGGTGSVSDSESLPPYLPDRFESGTANLPGVYGWNAALDYVNQIGVDTLQSHEQALTRQFLQGLSAAEQIACPGTREAQGRVGVIAVDFLRHDNAEIADRLATEYGILTRCGLHCAPAAHRALGTFPRGVVRFSVGHKTTADEVTAVLAAIRALA